MTGMPTFSLPATMALVILGGCVGYILAWMIATF